jgi:hypothetical protein
MNKVFDIEIGEEVFISRSEFERYLGYDSNDANWKTKEEGGWLITYYYGGCRVGQYDLDEGLAQIFV